MRYLKIFEEFYQSDREDIEQCFIDATDYGFKLDIAQGKIKLKLPIDYLTASPYISSQLTDVLTLRITEHGLSIQSGPTNLYIKDKEILEMLINCARKILITKNIDEVKLAYRILHRSAYDVDADREAFIFCNIYPEI